MFENNRGVLSEYVDFLRAFFLRDFPQKAFEAFPALHLMSAWYYYLTSRHKEFERHADAAYKHIARIAVTDPQLIEFLMLMYSVDHRSDFAKEIRQFSVFGKFVKRFTDGGLIKNIASSTHNLPFFHRSSFDYSSAAPELKNGIVEKTRIGKASEAGKYLPAGMNVLLNLALSISGVVIGMAEAKLIARTIGE
jgi:LuxR family maltose regulon positive regulatory protein